MLQACKQGGISWEGIMRREWMKPPCGPAACSAMTFVGITIIAFFLLGLCGNPSRVLYTGVRQRVQPYQLNLHGLNSLSKVSPSR